MESYCQAAFVLFEHTISQKRCLVSEGRILVFITAYYIPDLYSPRLIKAACLCALAIIKRDYAHHNNSLIFARPNHPLLFRGTHRLHVSPAPHPSDVIWENIEVKPRARLLRRTFTNFITILLLAITLIFVVRVRNLASMWRGAADTYVCDVVPLVLGAPEKTLDDMIYHSQGNPYCTNPNSIYLGMTQMTASEAQARAGVCGDPCIHLGDSSSTTVKACNGYEYSQADVVKCFCLNVIGNEIFESDPVTAFNENRELYGSMCIDTAQNYIAAQVSSYRG